MTDRTADYLIDRRRLRRKLTFWRVTAFLAVIVVVGALGWRFARQGVGFEHQIARVAIEGLITGDKATLKLINDVAEAKSVDAVILSIQSPGGTTTGSDDVYTALRELSAKKPTVAVVRGLAASGAYIAALGADHIVAGGNSLVGSIGVLFQFPNFTKVLDTVGVKVESVKSSPLKASPNGLEPTTPEAQAALASLVADSYKWFKDLVKTRRQLSDSELAVVSDGRVFTGRQGLPLKLVDELGDEKTGIAWLEKNKGVSAKLPVRDWKPAAENGRLGILGVTADVADLLGQANLGTVLRQAERSSENASLDGLLVLWHADSIQ